MTVRNSVKLAHMICEADRIGLFCSVSFEYNEARFMVFDWGFAAINKWCDALWITTLYVKPKHRRKGHASRLLKKLIRRGIPFGLGCMKTNRVGLAFYRSLGLLETNTTLAIMFTNF